MTEPAPSPHSWLLYVAPMATFLVLTSAEDYLPKSAGGPHPTWYPVAYAVKIAVVAVVAWLCRSTWRDLRPWPGWKTIGLAVGLGIAVDVVWVGLDGLYPPLPFLGTRQGFDPTMLSGSGTVGFLAIRLVGLVIVVPWIEELFWRSFLIRVVIDPEFERVPVGRVTPAAAAITSVFFALAHPEWLPALLTGLAWAWLLWKTKSLSACVASHMAANLGLGLYVLVTGHWTFL